MAKCLLEAFEATPEHPTATADKDSYKAAVDLRLNRGNFLRNFGIPSPSSPSDRKSTSILQTQLFPPLADYLDSMELCLMAVVKICKPRKSEIFSANKEEIQ